MSDIELDELLEALAAEMVRRGVNSWGEIVGHLLEIAGNEAVTYTHTLTDDDEDDRPGRTLRERAIKRTIERAMDRALA